MAKSIIEELGDFGQSIWVDDISRAMMADGSLQKMIDLGLRGMTSNPTIFDKAIKESDAYNQQIKGSCGLGKDAFRIYDELTIKDIQTAADMFFLVYQKTKGLDGFVSLEINPKLSDNAGGSIAEVKRLSKAVNRPNVMFKIPATKEGLLAIEECIAGGININITLIFSVQQYVDTANAYLKGIRRWISAKNEAGNVHSVASVFVSRIDTVVDKLLETEGCVIGLKGKAAVANSALIYEKFQDILFSKEFNELKEKGANTQRVLWGSTSTKNPAYSDIKYISELIARDTVNTAPIKTFEAFLDHGKLIEAFTPESFGEARMYLQELRGAGIDMDQVCAGLLNDGVKAFVKSFDSLLGTLENKIETLCKK